MMVLVIGNPIDGIHIVGPFADGDEVQEYVDANRLERDEWWIADLEVVQDEYRRRYG